MAMPALKLKTETVTVENSTIKLESDVEHMKSNISDVRIDVKRLNDKFDALKETVDKGFAAINLRFEQMNTSRVYDRVWFLLIGASLLAVIAKVFKWI
jgi:predicted  nucleic acid-binding Zn-ribbon protein